MVGHSVVSFETLQPQPRHGQSERQQSRSSQRNIQEHIQNTRHFRQRQVPDFDFSVEAFFSDFHLLLFTMMLVFGCFHLFPGLLNVSGGSQASNFTKCLKIDVVSASHGASSKHDAGDTLLSPRTINPQQANSRVIWMKKHNLWPDS